MTDRDLSRAIASVLTGLAAGELSTAGEKLSGRYRADKNSGSLEHVGLTASDAEAAAYVASRMPATAAATRAALLAVAGLRPSLAPSSQLDLGAGPGAAAWAARAVWPSLGQVTLLEHDPRMARLGKSLAEVGPPAGRQWCWKAASIEATGLPAADLVTAAYVLGELELASALSTAEAAWRAARRLLVVVGPGTPAGFERVRAVRDRLAAIGARIVAPCPQQGPCPIEAPDWCHFAARLERSPVHRAIKRGRLGYEDEKFSYVAAVRELPAAVADSRVIRRPALRKRLVELELCCADGRARTVRVGHSKAAYATARTLRWGDAAPADVRPVT